MSAASNPEPLPVRWAIILVTAVVAAALVAGLTLLQTTSWPAAVLAALAAAGMTVSGLHQVVGG